MKLPETREQALWYLAAMIDGEGTVMNSISTHGRRIQIWNSEPELIEACKRCCEILEYHCLEGNHLNQGLKPGNIIYWLVISTQETLRRAASELPLQGQKKKKLKNAVASYRYEMPR